MTRKYAGYLKWSYSLHKDDILLRSKERMKKRDKNTKIWWSAEAAISSFFSRVENILNKSEERNNLDEEKQKKDRIKLLKAIIDIEIIKVENIPESYWKNQIQTMIDEWRWWDIAYIIENWIPEDIKRQETERIQKSQEESLDTWIDYLSDSTANYEIELKYLALKSILKMWIYDEETKKFKSRDKSTISPFPELNQEALANTFGFIKDLSEYINEREAIKNNSEISKAESKNKIKEVRLRYLKTLKVKNLEELENINDFANIYSYFFSKIPILSQEILKQTEWEWRKFDQNSDPQILVDTIDSYWTGWCTANMSFATTQLRAWDFYIYYTKDENNENKIPRLAIRMEWKKIEEIRWIAKNQNIDDYMDGILEEKLKEFWEDWKLYKKQVRDMKLLTEINQKLSKDKNAELTDDEITFLYEIYENIEWFWYERDPRIAKNLDKRDFKKDLSKALNINEEDISSDEKDILQQKNKIKYFHWILDLNLTEIPDNFEFPEIILWDLDLSNVKKIWSWVKFPKEISWHLYLSSLKEVPDNLEFPEKIWWNLDLSNVQTIWSWIKFPKEISWYLNFSLLEEIPDNFEFPEIILWDLNLKNVKKIWNWVKLPKKIDWHLYLSSLKEVPDNLEFPEKFWWNLDLSNVKKIWNWVKLPKKIDWYLDFSSLEEVPDNLEFPKKAWWNLNLSNVQTIWSWVKLPKKIGLDLNLSSLEKLPDNYTPPFLVEWEIIANETIKRELEEAIKKRQDESKKEDDNENWKW